MANRETVAGLLTKMGAEVPEKMSQDRMEKKVQHRLTKNGVPSDLTAEEKELVVALGFTTDSKSKPAAAKPKAEKPAPATTEPPPSKDEDEDEEKPAKKAKSDKPKGEGKKRASGALAAFRNAFKVKSSRKKADVIAEVVAAGGTESTATAYISWARREEKVLGFKIVDGENKEKEAVLRKIEKE